jgi:hypothetical protein
MTWPSTRPCTPSGTRTTARCFRGTGSPSRIPETEETRSVVVVEKCQSCMGVYWTMYGQTVVVIGSNSHQLR